eukprot:TRINITY_DN3001_c0_g1_i2.p1 TRINITY_DN3001_c0_g1~~TRINITY_DN3001_c0_g1_i2.p1  ORF type:complete len:274 (+),score=79.75 TRINITY_DN3001_c0_g1_i2:72-893(+)
MEQIHLLELLADHGAILSPEEKAFLQLSLSVLKSNNHFKTVQFWGRIDGIFGNYYIAVAFDEKRKRSYYFRQAETDFALLPEITEEDAEKALKIHLTFYGIPSHSYADGSETKENEDSEVEDEIPVNSFSELKRLSVVVRTISHETSVFPRGHLTLNMVTNIPSENIMFGGIKYDEATDLTQYYHDRSCIHHKTLAEFAKVNLEKSIDFCDCIAGDEPKGIWLCNRDKNLVVLRNIVWPGYTFAQVCDSPTFLSTYFGDGLPNRDYMFSMLEC